MKISLCFPQYNRIAYLKKALAIVAEQTYNDIEVVVSDDASTDDTETEIKALQGAYRYPLIYMRHPQNIGFDANVRKSLELGTGDYCMLLGNDDTLASSNAVQLLVDFLQKNERPEIGFCNYYEEGNPEQSFRRASQTGVIGTGPDIAIKFYRSFSFVAGIIFRKDVFEQHNTPKADGSIYVQMYLAARIISSGGRFFMIEDPLVMKDIVIDGNRANNYREKLIRKWKDYQPIDGGLKSLVNIVCEGFKDAGFNSRKYFYRIIKEVYRYPYIYWLFEYRNNKAFVSSVAMASGMRPSKMNSINLLSFFQRAKIRCWYLSSTLVGLFFPVFLFRWLKFRIYRFIKKTK